MESDFVCSRIIPMLCDIQNDPVANVRLNIAKTFGFLKEKLTSNTLEAIVLPILHNYLVDDDRDVRYFAQVGLDMLGV